MSPYLAGYIVIVSFMYVETLRHKERIYEYSLVLFGVVPGVWLGIVESGIRHLLIEVIICGLLGASCIFISAVASSIIHSRGTKGIIYRFNDFIHQINEVICEIIDLIYEIIHFKKKEYMGKRALMDLGQMAFMILYIPLRSLLRFLLEMLWVMILCGGVIAIFGVSIFYSIKLGHWIGVKI